MGGCFGLSRSTPSFGVPYVSSSIPDDLESLSDEELNALLLWEENKEELQADNPIRYGFTLPAWGDVLSDWDKYDVFIIFGGNRSSKSTLASRIGVHIMETIPGAKARCWTVNQDQSIRDQQAMVWSQMPQRYRDMNGQKGVDYSIQYSQKNGFSGNVLILPPIGGVTEGSEMIFHSYKAWNHDPQISEGWPAHYIWCDEEVPLKLFETLLSRILDYGQHPIYRPKIILTFTTLKGMTPLMHKLTQGASTVKKRHAKLLANPEFKGVERRYPGLMLPYQQLPKSLSAKAFYFWTEDNPFIPHESVEALGKRSLDEVLQRAYGICSGLKGSPFRKLSPQVHFLDKYDIPFFKDRKAKVTHYQAIDPAGKKNWFWVYAGVMPSDDPELPYIYIWGEWPDISFGEWGMPSSKPHGKAGPAMDGLGVGLKGYKAIMDDVEGDTDIFERAIDKRFGNSTRTGREGETKLIDDLFSIGINCVTPSQKRVSGAENEIEIGVQLINNFLDYDESKPIDKDNRPHLYISNECENLKAALEQYTGEGGSKEVWKDPVDCLRILLEVGPRFVDLDEGRILPGNSSY